MRNDDVTQVGAVCFAIHNSGVLPTLVSFACVSTSRSELVTISSSVEHLQPVHSLSTSARAGRHEVEKSASRTVLAPTRVVYATLGKRRCGASFRGRSSKAFVSSPRPNRRLSRRPRRIRCEYTLTTARISTPKGKPSCFAHVSTSLFPFTPPWVGRKWVCSHPFSSARARRKANQLRIFYFPRCGRRDAPCRVASSTKLSNASVARRRKRLI